MRGPVRSSFCPLVCPPVCPFQLASESLRDIVARRRSDYCPRGAIFKLEIIQEIFFVSKLV